MAAGLTSHGAMSCLPTAHWSSTSLLLSSRCVIVDDLFQDAQQHCLGKLYAGLQSFLALSLRCMVDIVAKNALGHHVSNKLPFTPPHYQSSNAKETTIKTHHKNHIKHSCHPSCVCVQSPRWYFPLEEPQSHASTGGPLYLGALPSKPAEQYFAVLPLRPPPEHKVFFCCNPRTMFASYDMSYTRYPFLLLTHTLLIMLCHLICEAILLQYMTSWYPL